MSDLNRKPTSIILPCSKGETVGVWSGTVAVYVSDAEKSVVIAQMDNRKSAKVLAPLALVASGPDRKMQLQYVDDRGQLKHADVTETAYEQAILRMLVGLRDSVKPVMGVVRHEVNGPLKPEPEAVIVDRFDGPDAIHAALNEAELERAS